ncbi:uncharacterized protein KIAA2026 isoform X2 [Limanda limanda]|uniref:uncharacterized protein KIAA2026 isoform X2 n=1 Tax=Limanda limanda TaxID=27771 RepID=UPI0029C8F642|nr:uncharacterized protein KIAA2026 isoform X2 [Limanda limanda]
MEEEDMTEQITAACSQTLFHNPDLTVADRGPAPWQLSSDLGTTEDGLSNGTCEAETMDHPALKSDHMSDFSNSDLSLPEVCISTNSNSPEEDNMNHEVQQAYRIFTCFLLDKHKGMAGPFLQPAGHQEAQHGIGGVRGRGQAQLRQSMCLRRMEEKFTSQEYGTITEFVADFRLMLENCYRHHGVDHWISKQAQKLEIMLEQKLTLLSRTLREKTTLAVTSKGRFGAEEERGSGGTSTRRRLAPRSLATITVGGHESVMVQSLRQEEQQRAKDEKRQRELEKKEAEEMSAKEVEEWEQTLLSQASPHTVDALWELPAIGHFLCLAQTALNLPEIVFFELERCLLMPRCSLLLSKIMSSLLSPPQRRATLSRRPALPYRRWESELRQKVMTWYRVVGASHDQPGRAEQLGLSLQFFRTLGEVSPMEENPFHLLPFYQRVWLLKGLCDNVYETQKSVQDALLAQPIHECRESILGYDSKENAYIHFPHFCGADLRIYCQSPSAPPAFPFPSVWVKRLEMEPGTEGEESDGMKADGNESDREWYGRSIDTGESDDFGKGRAETFGLFERENGDEKEHKGFKFWSLKKEEGSESGSSDGISCEDSKLDLKIHTNSSALPYTSPTRTRGVKIPLKEETVELEHQSKRLKRKRGTSLSSTRTIDADTQEPCLSVGEHSYTGRSPARSGNLASPTKLVGLKIEGESQGRKRTSCIQCYESKTGNAESAGRGCLCGTSGSATQVSSERARNSSEERASDKIWTKKKKRKKMRGGEQLPAVKGEHMQLQHEDRVRLCPAEAAKPAVRPVATTIKRKEGKKKHKTGKDLESSKNITDEPSAEPSFKLVCTSLQELRELISKTEDELDDLESTKKRLGRWYHRREAVKDLHSTLIRLLNELSPWEPKLVKAYQRNRLRLKKEFDDFKKHPEYNNFVREECVSSSSSDEEEEEERDFGKDMFSLTDVYRRSEEEDFEHVVPRGLWSGASARGFGGESVATYTPPIALKHPLSSTETGVSLLPRVQAGGRNIASTADSGPPSTSELIPSNQSMDPNSACAPGLPAQTPLSLRPTILHPTTGLPKGYTPIPTLLAKSVGNKVTLMKRPADGSGFNNIDRQSKGSLFSLPASAMVTTKLSKAQTSQSSSQQFSQQMQPQGQQHTQVHRQSGMATVTAAPLKSPQAKPTQTVPKSPVQVVCKAPEGLAPLPGKDSLQQVVILTSNILIPKAEEKAPSLHQQQSKDIQAPVSKVASPFCFSTSVPGFTIPENRIPVQQVAPLKDARTVRTPSPSFPPSQQQGVLNTAGFKRAHICSPKASSPHGVMPNLSSIRSPSSAVSTEPLESKELKQELKTVCIRDSQSILVTTRGGNTGIVRVQSSSGHGGLGSSPASPVITISPQFKAFLVSKSSTAFSPSAPAQTSPFSIPAVTSVSAAQPQKQDPSVLKTLSTLTSPMHTAVTGSIPIAVPGSQTTATSVALSQDSYTSACSTAAKKIGQLAQTAAAASHFQTSSVKNPAAVPSLSSTGVPQVLTQAEVSKTGVKRLIADERSQVTKFILVTPSSTPTSGLALSKGTTSSTKSPTSSRVMFISQPSATSPPTFMGSIPKQAIAAAASGQQLTTSLPHQTLKMGSSPGQPISTEASPMVQNISLPSGVQIQLSGKTTTNGQTIGALSRSPSKSTSLSDTGCPTAATHGLVPVTNILTPCPAQHAPHASLTSSYPHQGTASFTMPYQTGMSTSAAATLPAGNTIQKPLSMSASEPPSSTPAQVNTTVQSRPAQTTTPTHVRQQSYIQSGIGEETSFSSSSQLAQNYTHKSISSATTTSPPFSTPSTGTIQQRVVINTSTPLAAGTQIILNNARFVVPPQGLGPGSHVLIISSPAPQQVPTASVTSTGASAPPQRASHASVAPQVLPQSPARLPGVPAVSSPFVTCSPAVGPTLLATTPNVKPVQLTGAPGLGSTMLHSRTNVSALPSLSSAQAGHFASSPLGSPTLVSPPPRLGSVPSLLSPVVTSAPAFHSAPAPFRLPAGTATQANCSTTVLSAAAHSLPRFSVPLSSLSVLPSPSAVSLSSPVIPVPTPMSSAAAPLITGTPLPSSVAAQQCQSTRPQQTAVRMAASSTALSQALLHTGLSNTCIRKQVPALMQPVLAGTRTQAVPPIVSTVSRMQTLPVATVPPIGSTVNTYETALVGTTPPSSSTVIITSAQPITSVKTNTTIHPPVFLTNPALGKLSLQTSALGFHTNVASKLLISPDGAVLSTAQCQVHPTELTACPKPLDALLVSPNSSRGALLTHDSSFLPPQADTK